MNSVRGTRHDNKDNADHEAGDKRRGMKLVSRNEGAKPRRALRIGISEDLFSQPQRNPIDRFHIMSNAASGAVTVSDDSILAPDLPDINGERTQTPEKAPTTAIFIPLVTGLIIGFLIGRRL